METLLSLCVGFGLAAACGMRVFVPLLFLSIAARAGFLNLSPSFEWLGSTPSLIALGVACSLEIVAYYFPWVDHALDTISTPAAAIAGVFVVGAQVTDLHPMLHWAGAAIGGGTIAGLVQTSSVAARATSTITTGGVGNPVVATVENVGSTAVSLLAILVPILVVIFGAIAALLLLRYVMKRKSKAVPIEHQTPATPAHRLSASAPAHPKPATLG